VNNLNQVIKPLPKELPREDIDKGEANRHNTLALVNKLTVLFGKAEVCGHTVKVEKKADGETLWYMTKQRLILGWSANELPKVPVMCSGCAKKKHVHESAAARADFDARR
jgi:hypothetical protein